jgi:hypothetical protein
MTGGAVVVNIGYEKYAAGVPDWLFILLCLIVLSIWFYWIWTHEKVKEYRRLVYTYPIMSLTLMIFLGAGIGCSIGALLWWSIYRQPQSASILEQDRTAAQAQNTEKPLKLEDKTNQTPVPPSNTNVPTPIITPVLAQSPSASPTPKQPTFSEGIGAVMFTVGNNSHTVEAFDLQNGKYNFFIQDVPATLYFENGKPFIDVDLYAPPDEPPVRLEHNRLLSKPSQWAMNFDDNALEVVDEKQRPIFQLYYKSPSHIVMYGVFFNGYVNWLASPEGYASTPNLDKKPYPLKRLFKYPPSKFLHRRAGKPR